MDRAHLDNLDIRWPGFGLAQAFGDYGSFKSELLGFSQANRHLTRESQLSCQANFTDQNCICPYRQVFHGRCDGCCNRQVSGGFIQQDPDEGRLATEPTLVWLTFDERNIYIGARCRDSHPERIVANDERETELIFRTMRNTSRVAKNAISTKVVAMEKAGAKFEDVRELVAGARGKMVYATGDADEGIWSAGQVQGLIHDIPTCAELVSRMMAECRQHLDRARGYFDR